MVLVQVLCDTSFLMVLVAKPLKQVGKVEAQLGRLDFLVPDVVMDELARLEQKAGPKRSMLARTAAELARTKFRTVSVPKAKHVDDSIIGYATSTAGNGDEKNRKGGRCAVATIDTNLRRRLIANNILVITLSKDRLIVANPQLGDDYYRRRRQDGNFK